MATEGEVVACADQSHRALQQISQQGSLEAAAKLHPRRKPIRWAMPEGLNRDSPPGWRGRPGRKGRAQVQPGLRSRASARFSTVAAVAAWPGR